MAQADQKPMNTEEQVQIKQLEKQLEKANEDKQALRNQLQSFKDPHRYKANFWCKVGKQLKSDTGAIKKLIKNKSIKKDDTDAKGKNLLHYAAKYGVNHLYKCI